MWSLKYELLSVYLEISWKLHSTKNKIKNTRFKKQKLKLCDEVFTWKVVGVELN